MQGRKLSEATIKTIWRYRGEGKSIDGIMSAMAEEEESVEVSRGSVARYAKEYDELSEAQKEAYRPLQWDALIHDEDFSLEDIRFLLDIWAAIGGVRVPRTGEARWMVRLRHLTPHLPLRRVYILAMQYHDRELKAAAGEEVDNSDLWGYIAFEDHALDLTLTKDESAKRKEWYEECVRKGKFPRLFAKPGDNGERGNIHL